MDMNSTLARLATGLAVKAIAAGFAIYLAITVAHYVSDVFSKVNNALPM